MKILNAIHAQTIGGVEQMFRNYTKALRLKQHDVSLLISNNGNDNYKNLNVKKIFKLQNFSQIFDCLKLLFILCFVRPKIIICHSNRLMKWMRILRYFSATKSVAINHGISFKSSLDCDYIININAQISQMVIDFGALSSKVFTLQNVIEIDEKYQQKNFQTPLKIGIYGRVEPRKGFDILLAAAKILQQKNIDFRLKIGGFEVHGGYNWSVLRALAQEQNILDKCEFVGVVHDKKSFFQDVDIFCVPSREEPFGLVILEGFLHSTLVISSDSVGGKMLVNHEVDGLLFENENSGDLAQKIIFAINNKERYHNWTQNAYLKLNEKFGIKNFADELDEILRKIK